MARGVETATSVARPNRRPIEAPSARHKALLLMVERGVVPVRAKATSCEQWCTSDKGDGGKGDTI